MAVFLSPVGGVAAQFFTNTGAVLTGGKIYTYAAGTTTPAVTYTNSGGGTPQPNPIVLDAAGRVSGSGEIWLADGIQYKFVLKDSNDVLIATYDNILGINASFSNFIANQEIQTATAGQTVFTLANSYTPGANTLSVFVDGVNQYGPGAAYAYYETGTNTVTFVSGLHVGASVKFTTVQSLTSTQATDASLVTYNEGDTGAVTYTVQAKLRQYISVKDFGAVGNGVADDTAAIASAIAAANGKSLYFPSGTYKITAPQAFTNIDNTVFFGDKFSSIISVATIIDAWSFDNTCSNLTFDGLTFAGKSVGTEVKYALDIKAPRSLVQNCYFYDFNQGVKINDENAVDCKVLNNQFTNIKGGTSGNGYGVYNIGSRTLISGNSFVSVGRHDIYLSGSSPQGSQFCTVTDNTSLSNGVEAIALYNTAAYQPVSGCVISGNVIRSCSGIGIGLDVNATNNIVSNNSIFFAGSYGIRLEGGVPAGSYPNANIISNNLIANPATTHIDVVNASNNILVGNSCISDSITPSSLAGITLTSTGSPSPFPTGNIIGNTFYSPMLSGPSIGSNAGVYYGLELRQEQSLWLTATNNSATPSVASARNVIFANSSPTTITNLTNGKEGQQVTLYFDNGNTTISLANFFLAGGVNFVGTQYDTLTLVKKGTNWFEVARSLN